MQEKKEVSRRDFLRTAGSTALFAALGIGIYGCGNTTDAGVDLADNDQDGPGDPPSTMGGIQGLTEIRSSNEGVTVDGDKITLDLNSESLSKLKDEGQAIWLSDEEVLTVNVDGTVIRSFTAVCTHSGCSDSWSLGGNQLECTCHGSRFNSNGGVVRGPAQSDLPEFTTSREGEDENIVTITKG